LARVATEWQLLQRAAVPASESTFPTELLACPSCRGELVQRPGRLACAGCERTYVVDDGVPNLVPKSTPAVDGRAPGVVGRALSSVAAAPVVYDLIQRGMGAREAARRMTHNLADAEGALVLDAGAGTGLVEATLPRSARYLWLDWDPRKLKGFRARSRSSAILGDATRIPLKDESVDWAISSGVSHHLDDASLGRMLDELRRVTRDRVVFVDAVVSPSLTSRLLWRYDPGRHPRSAEVLKRELEARFEVASAEEYRIRHRYLLVRASR
jgi:SAM-dependent methyltransferase/uncharacterized protein YbaR (Trm112 family)